MGAKETLFLRVHAHTLISDKRYPIFPQCLRVGRSQLVLSWWIISATLSRACYCLVLIYRGFWSQVNSRPLLPPTPVSSLCLSSASLFGLEDVWLITPETKRSVWRLSVNKNTCGWDRTHQGLSKHYLHLFCSHTRSYGWACNAACKHFERSTNKSGSN